ncbi:MAG: hypothetical protein IJF07_03625 [Lachnospiraceae bacterium]|nr:hypothetical protein [Lachnospiraceae bacterium]
MRVSVCVGSYATIPYTIEELELSVYSMEELCYCLKENAFLLDVSLMNDVLLNWMERECGVKDLARELYQLVHKKGSLSAFVSMILEYTGLYKDEVVQEVERVLKQGAGLSNIEKRKKQIDYLAGKKKYAAAIRGYDSLLEQWQLDKTEELPAANVHASILYNKGVVCAKLMLYQQAAEAFIAAYEQWNEEEYLKAYLAAKRMELSEEEYIALISENKEYYTLSLELEKKLESLVQSFKVQDGYVQSYSEQSEELILRLKENYRSSVSE